MKPAAIVATLALHAAAFGASWQFLAVPARNDFRTLEVALLPVSGGATAASGGRDAAAPAGAALAASTPISSTTPVLRQHTVLAAASSATTSLAVRLQLPDAPASRAAGVASGGAGGGASDGGAGKAAGSGGTANISGSAGDSTPVSLPADYLASNRKPEYPLLARQNDEQGTVLLRVLVSENGRASKVQLAQSSGYPLLDQSALSAVQSWRFRPATRNSQPVAEWYRLAIPFKLRS